MRLPYNVTGMLWTVPIKPWDVCVQELLRYLRGKNKAYYTPHVDRGDYIIVINATKLNLPETNWTEKIYDHLQGYPGGRKEEIAKRSY